MTVSCEFFVISSCNMTPNCTLSIPFIAYRKIRTILNVPVIATCRTLRGLLSSKAIFHDCYEVLQKQILMLQEYCTLAHDFGRTFVPVIFLVNRFLLFEFLPCNRLLWLP
jgi:hypothetical protein